jgi:hypothetical protein
MIEPSKHYTLGSIGKVNGNLNPIHREIFLNFISQITFQPPM